MNLDHVRLFQRIVELGSLAAAAREAGISPTTVSERLTSLETKLGVSLLNRTTRSLSLTEAGRMLWEGADVVLEETANLETLIRHGAAMLSGLIRISAPSDLGRRIVSREIDRFQKDNPMVRFELHLSDGYADIVGEGFDMALRFGPIADSSLRSRSLGDWPRTICAAPEYLARKGAPAKPEDLLDHDCILMRFGDLLDNQWAFRVGAERRTVVVPGVRVSNDGALVRQWCLEGVGIALKSELDTSEHIRAGRLVPLLQDYRPSDTSFQMLFPPHRQQPRRVHAFADHLAAALRAERRGWEKSTSERN
ncbi:MAG: LysR family transcriptional regulator [Pseudomonadota bacterium]